MDSPTPLWADHELLPDLLQLTTHEAIAFWQSLAERPSNNGRSFSPDLPPQGHGAEQALAHFRQTYQASLTGSAGPRYFGFVTGGTTPAALMGDWLTSVYDQNASDQTSQAAAAIEASAVTMLRQLLGLPEGFNGRFVTGATMSNFVGLAIGRQWWGHQHGVDVAAAGMAGLPKLTVFSGSPHSCIYKSLSMLGLGRTALHSVPTLPGREAVDVAALRQALAAQKGAPCLVVANAGVVNTVDFDDIAAIAQLRQEFPFYLHVDAAFGGFAACSPRYQHLLAGWEQADSIAVDAHKWLNVPYDSAVQFSRHLPYQVEVFQNAAAAYLGAPNAADAFHLTPENSRRLRALPAWFSLVAYGAEGYRQIVEGNCDCAALLGQLIEESETFQLLAPVRMNVVTFSFKDTQMPKEQVTAFLARLRDSGQAFFTPTTFQNRPGMRAAFSNWRTTPADVQRTWQAMQEIVHV